MSQRRDQANLCIKLINVCHSVHEKLHSQECTFELKDGGEDGRDKQFCKNFLYPNVIISYSLYSRE